MSVKEFIEILEKMNQDADVIVEDEHTGNESDKICVNEYHHKMVYITAP